MNGVAKNLALSGVLALLTASFLGYKLMTFGPARGQPPELAPSASAAPIMPKLPPIHRAYVDLKSEISAIVTGPRDDGNPFYTAHFEPPPPPPPPPPEPEPDPEPEPPPPPPPPPPPTTKEVAVRYQGFFETAEGVRKAYVQKEDNLVLLGADDPVVGKWKIARIESRALWLSDGNGEELQLEFNKQKKVTVPIKESK